MGTNAEHLLYQTVSSRDGSGIMTELLRGDAISKSID